MALVTQLKVFLSGIALCYFDEEISNWRIFIPKIPENHIFKINVIKKEDNAPDKVLLSTEVALGGKVVIKNNSLPATSEFTPWLLSDNFDLSYIHGEAIPLLDTVEAYAAFVTLVGFPFLKSSSESPKRFYNLLKFKGGTLAGSKGEDSCRDVIFTTAQPKNKSLTSVTVNGQNIIDLRHSLQVSYEIYLDNDCKRVHNPKDETDDPDFKFYYNIIDQKGLNDPCEYKLKVIEKKCEVAGCGPGRATSIKIGPKLKSYLGN